MILADLSQILISNFMAQAGAFAEESVEEGMIRHMALNTIRSINVKFRKQYGNLVIACDSKDCWRKGPFPYYKANRKKQREDMNIDWDLLFSIIAKIRNELKTTFPYRVVEVPGAEADDIIGVLVRKYSKTEPILISSRDKDFIQLHVYPNVKQYDTIGDKFVEFPDPVRYLQEQILKGDSGDGVPNFKMLDDTFITKIRQKPMTSKVLEVADKTPQEICVDEKTKEPNEQYLRNYERNRIMIDLKNTPEDLQEIIIEAYDAQGGKDRKGLMNYFVKNKLKNLLPSLQDF